MTRFSSHDSNPRQKGAAWRCSLPLPAALLPILFAASFAPGVLFGSDPASAQSSYAAIQAQIRRYGCHLPQYANSVAGCRALHARARALAGSGSGSYRRSAPANRATPPAGGGGVFGFFFGGSNPNRYSRQSYGSRNNYNYSPTPYGGGGYRTMCVRLCDGYYFPLSYSTGRSGLMRDAERCESSCEAPAKLFYHYSSGKVESMIDLEGQPYSSLENAFLYRKEYVADCRCKPEPWSEAAKEEYKRREEMEESGETIKEELTPPPVANNSRYNRQYRQQPRYYQVPTTAWQRPQQPRPRNSFNPFGRWFN